MGVYVLSAFVAGLTVSMIILWALLKHYDKRVHKHWLEQQRIKIEVATLAASLSHLQRGLSSLTTGFDSTESWLKSSKDMLSDMQKNIGA